MELFHPLLSAKVDLTKASKSLHAGHQDVLGGEIMVDRAGKRFGTLSRFG